MNTNRFCPCNQTLTDTTGSVQNVMNKNLELEEGKIEIVASGTHTRGTTFALAEANFSTGGTGRKLP